LTGENDIWNRNSKETGMVNALEDEVKRLMAEADLEASDEDSIEDHKKKPKKSLTISKPLT
jgi:hypothetical protein